MTRRTLLLLSVLIATGSMFVLNAGIAAAQSAPTTPAPASCSPYYDNAANRWRIPCATLRVSNTPAEQQSTESSRQSASSYRATNRQASADPAPAKANEVPPLSGSLAQGGRFSLVGSREANVSDSQAERVNDRLRDASGRGKDFFTGIKLSFPLN